MYANIRIERRNSPEHDLVLLLHFGVKLEDDPPSRLPGWNKLPPYSCAAGIEYVGYVGIGWCVEGVWAFIEARLLLSGLQPSIFIPSDIDIWYLIDSFSSILFPEDVGEAAPGSGETSFGGVGGKL